MGSIELINDKFVLPNHAFITFEYGLVGLLFSFKLTGQENL